MKPTMKLIIFLFLSFFVGYSMIDAYVVQPAQRPDYCDDCMIPLTTEQDQQTAIVGAGLLGAGVAGNRMIRKKETEDT